MSSTSRRLGIGLQVAKLASEIAVPSTTAELVASARAAIARIEAERCEGGGGCGFAACLHHPSILKQNLIHAIAWLERAIEGSEDYDQARIEIRISLRAVAPMGRSTPAAGGVRP